MTLLIGADYLGEEAPVDRYEFCATHKTFFPRLPQASPTARLGSSTPTSSWRFKVTELQGFRQAGEMHSPSANAGPSSYDGKAATLSCAARAAD